MPKQKAARKELAQSTAQQLASIVKSCRDIMRKDKGLNGDLDRLPMLTWIMFVKFLDDMESVRAEEAKLSGKRFRPAIEPPYRWRDWAANPQGITGPELIAFINQDEAIRPDRKRGDGLFAYLRSLHSPNGDRRDVIAKVFQGTFNRMTNGYLLRDVINKINEIHFTSKDQIHTLGLLYESMLREMRDSAGDSGEFYTPRPVVKFIVSVMNPHLGETILDPAAGTGGFLVEAFTHLQKQCKKTEDFNRLQRGTLFGIEPKPLPYLLCQMNLLLHGLVIRIRPNPNQIMPEYLNIYLNSPSGRGQMLERSRTTSGLFNLSVGRIKELEIPLPSLAEQCRVVAEVGNLESTISPLVKLQYESAAEIDALMPSILSKAFRGEL